MFDADGTGGGAIGEAVSFMVPGGAEVADTCAACGKPFEKKRANHVTCSRTCERRHATLKNGGTPRADLVPKLCACGDTFTPRNAKQITCGAKACKSRRHDSLRLKEVPCEFCSAPFRQRQPKQTTCRAAECRKKAQARRFERWYAKPGNADVHRKRTAARMRERRGTVAPEPVAATVVDPWAAAPPAYDKHLPGGAMWVRFSPYREVPHRLVRYLHGIVTQALGMPHGQTADFSLLHVTTQMSPSGWGVYVRDEAAARALAGSVTQSRFGNAATTVTFGPFVRLHAPRVTETGRHRVRLDTITPVVIRSAGRSARRPTKFSLWSALTQAFPGRLGVELDGHAVGLEVVASRTEVIHMPMGKIGGGAVVGWSGSVTLDVNPIGRWLLECADRLGLGGKTAFGFGRVRVTDLAAEDPVEGEPPTFEDVDVVSDTAAEKYAVARGIGVEQARVDLTCAADAAHFVETLSAGAELWQHDGLRLVVRPGPLRAPRVIAAIPSGEPLEMPITEEASGGANGRFFVTPHAVTRYIERIMQPPGDVAAAVADPGMRAQALAQLIDLTSSGRYVDAWTGDPGEGRGPFGLWRGPRVGTTGQPDRRSRLRFIVGRGEGDLPAVVTVLPLTQDGP